jgi:hypothetical protein
LVFITFKCFCIIVCGMFCQAGLRMKATQTVSTWVSVTGAFSFTNAASLIKQFIQLVNQHFCWWCHSKHCMKSPLHCNCIPRFVKPQHIFSVFNLRYHFNSYECSTSGGKSWKLKRQEL